MRILTGELFGRLVAVLGAFVTLNALGIAPALAQVKLVVNSTGDAADISPRNGVCETVPGNRVCTLRAAIQESNAQAGADSISFRIPTTDPYYDPTTGVSTIRLNTSLPTISDSVQITGPGADRLTVRPALPEEYKGSAFAVLAVSATGVVGLTGMTIKGGFADLPGIKGGGAVRNLSTGTVNITNCVLSDNRINYDGEGGGAIYNASTGIINVTGSTLKRNDAFRDDYTVRYGGAIYNDIGTVNVTNSNFFDNRSYLGGAVLNRSGVLTITASTFAENRASHGGAVVNVSGQLSVINSTFVNNIASNNADLRIGRGGAIWNQGGTLRVTNSTLTGNYAVFAAALYNSAPGVAIVKSTIIAQNYGGGALGRGAGVTSAVEWSDGFGVDPAAPDVAGTFTSQGFNLVGVRDGSTGFTVATDSSGTLASPLVVKFDAKGLRNNGGPTPTIALTSGSPAIDKGTSLGIHGVLSTDQRGGTFLRTVDKGTANAAGGDGTDIGAYELK
jgi:CSLREA domain-containing protein